MSKNNRVFVIFFSILLFLTVGMSEKAYAEKISGTVHNELVGTFDKSQTSNRTIEEMKKIARDDHNVTLLITNNQVTISENIGVSDGATLRVQNQEVPIKNGKFTDNTKKYSTVDCKINPNAVRTKKISFL
ncbi:hypothetical protein IMAU10566_02796 [Lactiplantibacillus plantarum]|nr:hypothetical protein [Lactiplantibacillus plantarum]